VLLVPPRPIQGFERFNQDDQLELLRSDARDRRSCRDVSTVTA
jgi:hypothetical protein